MLILKCSVILQARSQTSGHANESRQDTSESGPERACSASQALIEMAVKTGLSLLFALLHQSWQQTTVPGIISFIFFWCSNAADFSLLIHLSAVETQTTHRPKEKVKVVLL